MIALADVFRRFADDYQSAHAGSLLPSHGRAIADILACRTEQLGGHFWRCDHCSAELFSYHSCKNRSCPRCHKDQTERWIAARKAELLACPYFHVTVTVPQELREVLRANQRDGYAALMKAVAEAIIELARDRRHVGGAVGVMAVLHSWTQQLIYHPHVHCLVTGGGVSDDGRDWHPARRNYLVPTKALAKLVRGKLKSALEKRRPDLVVPPAVWSKPWVVHCTAWGDGAEAVLRYLARYVFRVAITESRIVGLDDTGVTIRHKHRASNRWRRTRLDGHEFMRRFLQHVLPKGLHKVRYYGLCCDAVARARQLLALDRSAIARPDQTTADPVGAGDRQSATPASSCAAHLSLLQGWPPRACAPALPHAGAWTMSSRNRCEPWALRVLAVPRLGVVRAPPALAQTHKLYPPALQIMHRNRQARERHADAQAQSSCPGAIKRLAGQLKNP